MKVAVAYALPDRQFLREIELPEGSTAAQAIESSGLAAEFPDYADRASGIGIFGKPVTVDTMLKPGDRVEIYRPLLMEPGEARRKRVRGSGVRGRGR